jgi:hypothetical protein
VTVAARRDEDTADEVIELSVATLDLPVERVRVRVIDEYAAVEPPEGGAGGEPGGGGESGTGDGESGTGGDGGASGQAGESGGGAGPGTGGTARGGSGTGAEGGEAAGGEATGGDLIAKDESSDGCGCALGRRSGNGAAVLLAALALLRRVRRRGVRPSCAARARAR